MLKYQYKIDHTQVYGCLEIVNKLCMHMVSQSRRLTTNGNQEEDRSFLLDMDKPHICYISSREDAVQSAIATSHRRWEVVLGCPCQLSVPKAFEVRS